MSGRLAYYGLQRRARQGSLRKNGGQKTALAHLEGSRRSGSARLCRGRGFPESHRARPAGVYLVGIPIQENLILTAEGTYKLTRFACYLIAMNADPKKAQVGAAVYFASIAETFKNALESADAIERVAIRDEMTDGMKSLNGTATAHGVVEMGLFHNAGYRGMYNMNLSRLKQMKGLPDGQVLLDRMGKFANLPAICSGSPRRRLPSRPKD